MKVGDIINPLELGERSFDPIELHRAIRNLQIVWCWGAQAWAAHKDKFLRFKSNGYLHKGHVYIILGWNDTFTVILTTLKGKVLSIDEEIYVDVLVNQIDARVETK